MSTLNKSLVVLVGSLSLLMANDALAECSGGRGGPTGGSRGGGSLAAMPVTMLGTVSTPSGDSFAREYARQMQMQQMYQAQQRFLAMRQQLTRQRAEQQYASQQELLTVRQQRARLTREKRTQRIARAKAKREAQQLETQRYVSEPTDVDSGANRATDSLIALVR